MAIWTIACLVLGAGEPITRLDVQPSEARIVGSAGSVQIVVTGYDGSGRAVDLTRKATYEVVEGDVTVEPNGLIRPRADGRAVVRIHCENQSATATITVADFADARRVHFSGEVVPILTKRGCNSGGCHGKASGQNGFRLSLLGFDPTFDFEALVSEGRGRRIFPAAPEMSLLVRKAVGTMPHGGGRPVAANSVESTTLVRWIAQGTPFDRGDEAKLTGLTVVPERRIVPRKHEQQLRVEARYSDGTTLDVTRLARFQSNSGDLAAVDDRGLLTTLEGAGEASVMVRYGGQVAVARATVPLGADVPDWTPPESANPIDRYVFAELKALGIPPSDTCTDAEFGRRTALDICGILPEPAEVAAFENDPAGDKRTRWVDRLLERPEYADHFAMKWSAILRNKRFQFGPNRADEESFALHAWLRQAMARNVPYDRFAASIVAAKGDPAQNPPAVLYRLFGKTQDELTDDTAQLFLGLRIQCARCHHHPFEKWSQDDYYGFASFFARVGRKAGSNPLTPRIYTLARGMARNPMSKKDQPPRALDGPELKDLGPRDDPRVALAAWMGRPENPFFARALVNRYWKHFFARGLVEPEDDMRVSNPATNPELLDWLAADFASNAYDLKRLVRTICTSRAYDRSSEPNAWNAADRGAYARYYPRRLSAEVLLDAVNVVAGSEEAFNGMPKGTRAAELPDEGFGSYFLDVFGRPKRESVCECERSIEPNLSQALHLLNSGEIQGKLAAGEGRAAKWTSDERSDAEKIDELYRVALGRPADADEREVCLAHLAKRRAENKLRLGYEDLLWAILNTKEFQFNR